tara:strand:+ start:90 stop:365 length:276 start_codon:yes stop_codon:yes gene_type:complete
MKTTLKLQNIEKTGSGVEYANIICELSENQYLDKETITVKLSCTSIAVRIMSDHLLGEMKHICENLDTEKVREFAKDMLKASKSLNEVRSI